MIRTLLVLVLLVAAPCAAAAQVQCAIDAFGHHAAGANLVAMPLGPDECDVPISIEVTGLTASGTQRYLDLWSAMSSTVACQTASTRASTMSPVCTTVDIAGGTAFVGTTRGLDLTPRELFGNCDSDAMRTLFVFDSVTMGDHTTSYASGEYCTIDMRFRATLPDGPVLADSAPADTSLTLNWTDPTEIPTPSGMSVYVDATGCGSSTLIAGAMPPITSRVTSVSPVAATTAQVATSTLGWTTAMYGEEVALGITVLDAAGNETALSNVICVTHTRAEIPDAGTDAGTAMPSGGGCGCTVGRSAPSIGWLALAALLLWRRRR